MTMSEMRTKAEYFAETARVIQCFDEKLLDTLVDRLLAARAEGRRVFIVGNGGSASLASHLACDFNKNCNLPGGARFKVIALTDNLATIMAYANDVSYDDIFVEQLKNLFERGDLLLGISGSGNSENVVRALRWARANGGFTAGWLAYGGGRCAPLCDVALVADTYDMQHAEDAHTVLMHLLMKVFMGKVAAGHVG